MFSNLLSFPKLLQNLEGHVVVAEEVVRHGEANPGSPLSRPELKQLVPSVLVTVEISHLDLEQREIAENLDVVFVPLEGVPVTLDGFIVLFVGSAKIKIVQKQDIQSFTVRF